MKRKTPPVHAFQDIGRGGNFHAQAASTGSEAAAPRTSFIEKTASGRRASNPRPPPWQGGVLPLNYSRSILRIRPARSCVSAGAARRKPDFAAPQPDPCLEVYTGTRKTATDPSCSARTTGVGERRVELLRLTAPDPKSGVSAIPPLARQEPSAGPPAGEKCGKWVVQDSNLWPAD